MKLIVGLGNPGVQYEKTRHNLGFIMIDNFALKNDIQFKNKFEGLFCKTNILGEEVILLKPQTFMNLSGSSVRKVVDYYNISLENILFIYDDLAMDFGKIKLKINSSAGGHNGMQDIINKLGTQSLFRIKFGILNDYKKDTKDFVLANFSKEEEKEIIQKKEVINDIIYDFIKTNAQDYEKIINKYN